MEDEVEVRETTRKYSRKRPLGKVYASLARGDISSRARIRAAERAIVPPLTVEQVREPLDLVFEKVDAHNGRCIVGFGEGYSEGGGHGGTGILDYEKTLVLALHERYKIKALFLEEDEAQMGNLREYYQTREMSEELREYLLHGFVRQDSLEDHDYKLKLIEACREASIPVYFVDKYDEDDRDLDWFNKITPVIGEEVDGLYMLIAGTNHIWKQDFRRDCTPVAMQLNKKYSGKVISINGMNLAPGRLKGHYDSVYQQQLADDLKELGLDDKPVAVDIKKPPYNHMLVTSIIDDIYEPLIAGKAVDIAIAVPGKDLFNPPGAKYV
jgi:hypothetical protein